MKESRLARLSAWLLRSARFAEDTALIVLLAALIGLAFSQIVLRNVFNSGLVWADELIRLIVLWVGLLGAIVASREKKHITVDVLGRMLRGRWSAAADFVTSGFTAAICALLAWVSWQFVLGQREFGETLLTGVPAWLIQLILPLCFALIGLRYALFAGADVIRLVRGERS